MSLQVCGGSLGLLLQEHGKLGGMERFCRNRTDLSPAAPASSGQSHGGHVYSRPSGLRHHFYQSVPSPFVKGRVLLRMPSECSSGHLSSLDYLWR